MHSRIFQLSTKRLPEEEWITDLSISEADMGYHGIDYCGENYDRENDLERLANVLPKEVFKVEGDKIEIISDGSCLWEAHKAKMIEVIKNMEYLGGETPYQSFFNLGGYKITCMAKNMLDTDFLFYIDDWNGCCGTSNDLLHYAIHAMASKDYPKVLYVNGILDYHL